MKHAAPIPAAALIENILASSALYGADQSTGGVPDEPSAEIACLFENVAAVMEVAGGTVADVVRMDVLVRENGVRELINDEWLRMYPDEGDRPARHITVIPDLKVQAQIELIAVLPTKSGGLA